MAMGAFDPKKCEEAARLELNRSIDHAGPVPSGVHIESFVRQRQRRRNVARHAIGADLIVVGSRGRDRFAGLLLGSVGQQCVHHAPKAQWSSSHAQQLCPQLARPRAARSTRPMSRGDRRDQPGMQAASSTTRTMRRPQSQRVARASAPTSCCVFDRLTIDPNRLFFLDDLCRGLEARSEAHATSPRRPVCHRHQPRWRVARC